MNAIKTTPHKQGHGSQEWTVIVGANTMVNPETVMESNGDCWCQYNGQSWKLWRDNGDLRLQEILHTKWSSQTVVCLPHTVMSCSAMPTTYDDFMQWYAYHIQWSHAVLCLPHIMISHNDMPTTYDDITQWYAYHIWYHTVICLPHTKISHSDRPTTYDYLMQRYAYHIQWSHAVLCLPHMMISHSDMPTISRSGMPATCDDFTQCYAYHMVISHSAMPTTWWSHTVM